MGQGGEEEEEEERGGGRGGYLRVVCLSHLTVGHALLSRRTWEGFFGSALHRA